MTRGCFDDGNGLARMQIVRHRHEIENGGRTSSMSEHMVGVTEDGSFMSLDMIGECDQLEDDVEPECQRLITFSDLAGHKKYLKVTASGLASQFPDYAILVVDSGRGVQEMTKEHLKIVTALEVAVLVVMTKTDVATDERIQQSIKEVEELFGSFSPEKTICIMDDNTSEKEDDDRESSNVVNANANANAIALFKISNVSRTGFEVLQRYLSSLTPRRAWQSNDSIAEFQINHSYDIQDAGTIVTGLVQSGTLHVGDEMLLGPDGQGKFQKIHIENIQVQRKPVRSLFAGETGAILISFDGCPSSEKHVDKDDDDVPLLRASFIRKGMMLVHPSLSPMATLQFDAEIHFLKDSPTIRENYQAVIHAGPIRQMAKLVRMELNEILLATTKQDQLRAICRFEFLYWPEYIRPDLPLVLREGSAHAVGKVVRAVYHGFDCTEQRVVQRRVKQCC
jgi:GTPase